MPSRDARGWRGVPTSRQANPSTPVPTVRRHPLAGDWSFPILSVVLLLLEPLANEPREALQLVKALQVSMHLIPIDTQVLVDQYVAKAGQRREGPSEISRKDPQFALPQDRLVIISRFRGSLQGDDAIANIDTALCSHLKIAFGNVSQIGVLIEGATRFLAQGLQAR